MKYIILDIDDIEMPIIFSSLMQHGDIALKFSDYKVVSAGKLDADWQPYGNSVSLKVSARPQADAALFKKHFEFAKREI